MDNKTVLSDNELIAEFMGFTKDARGFYTGGRFALRFNTSWNELMPVVEKIYRLEYDGVTYRGVKFTLKNSRAVIRDGKKTFTCHTLSPLNSTYRVVVEFIKWYNSTKTL